MALAIYICGTMQSEIRRYCRDGRRKILKAWMTKSAVMPVHPPIRVPMSQNV